MLYKFFELFFKSEYILGNGQHPPLPLMIKDYTFALFNLLTLP